MPSPKTWFHPLCWKALITSWLFGCPSLKQNSACSAPLCKFYISSKSHLIFEDNFDFSGKKSFLLHFNIIWFWGTTRQSKLFKRDEERIPRGFWQYLVYAVVVSVIYGAKTLLSPGPLTSCTRTSQPEMPKHLELLVLRCYPWPNPYLLHKIPHRHHREAEGEGRIKPVLMCSFQLHKHVKEPGFPKHFSISHLRFMCE